MAETAGTEIPGAPETPANPDYAEESIVAVPAEKPAETAKKGTVKPAKKTATNGFMLVTSKEAYNEANKDKTVATNGLPIEGRYPNVFSAIPDFKNCDTVEGVTVDDILRSAVIITEALKPFWCKQSQCVCEDAQGKGRQTDCVPQVGQQHRSGFDDIFGVIEEAIANSKTPEQCEFFESLLERELPGIAKEEKPAVNAPAENAPAENKPAENKAE